MNNYALPTKDFSSAMKQYVSDTRGLGGMLTPQAQANPVMTCTYIETLRQEQRSLVDELGKKLNVFCERLAPYQQQPEPGDPCNENTPERPTPPGLQAFAQTNKDLNRMIEQIDYVLNNLSI